VEKPDGFMHRNTLSEINCSNDRISVMLIIVNILVTSCGKSNNLDSS